MAEDSMDAEEIELIVSRIHDGLCIPFLGAAANFTGGGYEGLLLGTQVSEELAKTVDPKSPLTDKKNLARVALQYERVMDRPKLVERMKELLPDEKRTPSPLLTVLAELPFYLYITTNYDRLLERALKNKTPKVVVQTSDSLQGQSELKEWADKPPRERPPLIYKFHGTFCNVVFGEPDPSSVVVTEEDYIELLTSLGPEAKGVPNLITGKLQVSTILFLGYSLEDWDFRAVYKGLIERSSNKYPPKSFAIKKNPTPFWKDFWNKKGVVIKDVDVYAFANELRTAYFKKYPLPANGGKPTGGEIAAGT